MGNALSAAYSATPLRGVIPAPPATGWVVGGRGRKAKPLALNPGGGGSSPSPSSLWGAGTRPPYFVTPAERGRHASGDTRKNRRVTICKDCRVTDAETRSE